MNNELVTNLANDICLLIYDVLFKFCYIFPVLSLYFLKFNFLYNRIIDQNEENY